MLVSGMRAQGFRLDIYHVEGLSGSGYLWWPGVRLGVFWVKAAAEAIGQVV